MATGSAAMYLQEYLVHFAQAHLDFRLKEIDSLLSIAKEELQYCGFDFEIEFEKETHELHVPFARFLIRSSSLHGCELVAKTLFAKSVLAKDVYELWTCGDSYEDLARNFAHLTTARWPSYVGQDVKFRFSFVAYGQSLSMERRSEILEGYVCMGLLGQAALKEGRADVTFTILTAADHGTAYFGRHACTGGRDAITTLSLKRRQYLGTTSMDAEVALIMANQALVRKGKLVYDPFVGTGSILVACAHRGACVLGSDIDPRVLRGHGRGRRGEKNVASNFTQYNLTDRVAGLAVVDIQRAPWHMRGEIFDAIVTDPPYGVRAGARVGARASDDGADGLRLSTKQDERGTHTQCPVEELVPELMNMASTQLVDGGRLVFMMPAPLADGETLQESHFPRHPSLRLLSISIQCFGHWSRMLLTYEKLNKTSRIESFDLDSDQAGKGAQMQSGAFRNRYFKIEQTATE